jgi:Flp pilus assembly protein CpaB
MTGRHLIAALLIGGVSCAGGFFVGNRFGHQKADELAQNQTVPVLVAAEDLLVGTTFNDPKLLRPVAFLPDTVPPGAVTNFEDLRGKTLARTISKNVPVSIYDLSMLKALFKPAPPGKRALTIRAPFDRTGSAFFRPGSYIDVIGPEPDPDDPRKSTRKVLAQKILVLAVTQDPEFELLTLAVSMEEAKKIVAVSDPVTPVLHRPGE